MLVLGTSQRDELATRIQANSGRLGGHHAVIASVIAQIEMCLGLPSSAAQVDCTGGRDRALVNGA